MENVIYISLQARNVSFVIIIIYYVREQLPYLENTKYKTVNHVLEDSIFYFLVFMMYQCITYTAISTTYINNYHQFYIYS